MKYVEYGNKNRDVIVLLHGGGLSWWNYRESAELLSKDYHVILPILDGHSGSDADFTTIEDNAAEIIDFVDTHLGGSVLLMGGLSLGGQILVEILSQRKDICQYALIESAMVIPSKITHSMIAPAFGSSYGLIRRRWFSRLQFKYLKIKPELFEDYYRDTCGITKSNMIAFLQANALYAAKDSLGNTSAKAHIFVGGMEMGAMRRSARILHGKLSGSELHILPRLHHGEFSLNHPTDYAAWVSKIVTER